MGFLARSSRKGVKSGGRRLVGSGGITPSGGFRGVIGGKGIGILIPVSELEMYSNGILLRSWSKEKCRLSTLV